MFSREVSDIVVASMATFILFLVIMNPSDRTELLVIQYFMVALISVNFLHLILSQLNRVTKFQSRILAIINSTVILGSIGLFISVSTEIPEIQGFWDRISSGYVILFYTIFTIMLVFSLLALNAQFLYIRQDKRISNN